MRTVQELVEFTVEETDAIISAGKVLRDALNKVSSKDIAVSMTDESFKLVQAIADVSNSIVAEYEVGPEA